MSAQSISHFEEAKHVLFCNILLPPLSSTKYFLHTYIWHSRRFMFTKFHGQCTVKVQQFSIKYWWASCGLKTPPHSNHGRRSGLNKVRFRYWVFFAFYHYSLSSYLWGFFSLSALELYVSVKLCVTLLLWYFFLLRSFDWLIWDLTLWMSIPKNSKAEEGKERKEETCGFADYLGSPFFWHHPSPVDLSKRENCLNKTSTAKFLP